MAKPPVIRGPIANADLMQGGRVKAPPESLGGMYVVAGTPTDDGPDLATTLPADVGTAAVGSGVTAARGDHVHGHGAQAGGALHAAATGAAAGFMAAADKTKLDTLPATADAAGTAAAAQAAAEAHTITAGDGLTGGGTVGSNPTLNVAPEAGEGSIVVTADGVRVGVLATDAQHGARGGGTQHAVATTVAAGFMSAADKLKLDTAGAGDGCWSTDAIGDIVIAAGFTKAGKRLFEFDKTKNLGGLDGEWTEALAFSGTRALLAAVPGGCLQFDSGATANSNSQITSGTGGVRTPHLFPAGWTKWGIAALVRIPTAVDANSLILVGLSSDTGNDQLFVGMSGAVSATKYFLKVTQGGVSENTLSVIAIDTGWHVIKAWSNGVNNFLQVDSETPVTAAVTKTMAAAAGPLITCRNGATAASRKLDLAGLAFVWDIE